MFTFKKEEKSEKKKFSFNINQMDRAWWQTIGN